MNERAIASPQSRPDPAARPTSATERVHALDAIRGAAILGVLLAYTVWSLGNPPEAEWSRLDRLVERLMGLLVDNRFLTLFAFLFGVGVAQQWRRWEAAGADVRRLHLRRMGFLGGLGLLHAVFLRNGDILLPYALLGLALLLFRRGSGPLLVGCIVVFLLLPTLFEWAVPRLGLAWPARPSAAGRPYVLENLEWLRHWFVTNPLRSWPRVIGLMLAGVLAGRARLFERLAIDRPLQRRFLAVAAAVAGVMTLALVVWQGRSDCAPASLECLGRDLLAHATAWAVASAYLALAFFVLGAGTPDRLSWLRAVGRMAFTNYVLQAVIAVPICLAFGLFDRISPTRGVLAALLIGLGQAAFSVWWLRSHSMGPLERLWRRFTYGAPA
ncbi:MAG TPA: DUF418 domain-containing protein [Candidatus Polarisedimenticolia bacterium]|nr:DUF418 domain-containing protein [Candidatus Polarisedimenticolia bacterium]